MKPITTILFALVAACGGSTPNETTVDAPAALSCNGVFKCLSTCASGDTACQTTCIGRATPDGNMYFQALLTCGYTQCAMPDATGTVACASTSDTSAACSACVAASGQTSACATEATACLAH